MDDIKLAGKKRNINPTWKVRMEDVDLGEPTSFLDHVYLGCTQRENVRLARILWGITKVCLNLGFLLVLWKDYEMPKLHGNLSQTLLSSWSCDMEGHAIKSTKGRTPR